MAFTDTVLYNARTEVLTNKGFELRPEFSMAIDACLKYRDQSVVNLAKIRKASTQTATILYNAKTDYAPTTGGKSCTPSGTQGATEKEDLTWVTRTVIPYVDHKVHSGNELAMQDAFNVAFYNALESLFISGTNSIDAYVIAQLEANKSDTNIGSIGTFDTYGDDTMTIALADMDEFYNIVDSEMLENNYNKPYQDIYNTAWNRRKNYYVNQGSGNSTNTAFQFNGYEFYPSNNIDAANSTYYTNGVHYIVPKGGIALIDWSENDATGITGKKVGGQAWGSMDGMFYPNIRLDTFTYETCVDSTANGGAKQDIRTAVEITATIAFVKQPTPTGSPIFKYGILAA